MHASESESRSEPALVRPFRELGSGDLGQVGGKNASLGEMIRSLGTRGPGSRWLCHHLPRLPTLPGRERAGGSHPGKVWPPWTPGTSPWPRRGSASGADPGGGTSPRTWPRPSGRPTGTSAGRRGRGRGRGGPEQRHGRGPPRRQLRRTAGQLPERDRRGGAPGDLPPLLRLPLHRPGHRLPSEPGGSTTWRWPSPWGCSGWCAPTRGAPGSSSPWTRRRLPRRGGHHVGLGVGRGGGAGHHLPRPVPGLQGPPGPGGPGPHPGAGAGVEGGEGGLPGGGRERVRPHLQEEREPSPSPTTRS
jgi:translation initiation factor IF-2